MADNNEKNGLYPMAWVGSWWGAIVLALLLMGYKNEVEEDVKDPEKIPARAVIKTPRGEAPTGEQESKSTIREDKTGEVVAASGGGLEKMPKMFEVPKSVTGWKSMMHREKDGKAIGMVSGESTETVEALAESFTRALTLAGFQEASRVSVAHTTNISFQKKETNQNVTVSLVEDSGKRMVQLTYTER